MIKLFRRAVLGFVLAAAICAAGNPAFTPASQSAEKISQTGKYEGYSAAGYDGWTRNSIYLPMRDGVRIAVDIFRPTKGGKAAEEKLPVVWVQRRYQRASMRNGKVAGLLPASGPHLAALSNHGYVLASADSRGTGASFGVCRGVYTEDEAADAYEITEWLAAQPWSNGSVGMIGSSYEGTNQLTAAGKKPPHLKAIVPVMAMFDLYDLAYPGGIFRYDLVKTWTELTQRIDLNQPPAPVDADADGLLVKDALRRRPENRPAYGIVAPLKYRDDTDPGTGRKIYQTWQPSGFFKEIRESGVAVYLICGWQDAYIRDGFLMAANLGPRFKMVVLDCPHSPNDPTIIPEAVVILVSEPLRWFDYWLKGIDNGVTEESPIRFQTNVADTTRIWRTADRWPLPETVVRPLFFQSGPSGSVSSVNDGKLTAAAPQQKTGGDLYTADASTTSGQKSRWDNTAAGDFGYPDMTANDAKGLTYTTEVLTEDLDATGHPVLHLWVDSTAADGDFIAYLEEVDPKGFSRYVGEGCLRASHRALNPPPYENFGLPYHRSDREDVVPLTPGAPAELVFDFLPVSNVFNAGNRLRVTIVCADKDNLETPAAGSAAKFSILRNEKFASRLDLPVVPKTAGSGR